MCSPRLFILEEAMIVSLWWGVHGRSLRHVQSSTFSIHHVSRRIVILLITVVGRSR
jgi:hypothetical protein